jgi:hypothetical protein
MKLVSHRSFEPGLDLIQSQPLRRRSAFELADGPSADDAEARALLSEALSSLRAEAAPRGILVSPQNQLGSLIQSYLTEHPEGLDLIVEPAPNQAFEVKYDSGDIVGWALSVLDWWRRIRPEKWLSPPDTPERIGDGGRLRVAVLGDWGTGMYGAPVISKAIAADGIYDLLLHLGDVYYAGTPKEVRENFIDFWPQVPGAVSRALNSNHEMYSGGQGLFRETLPHFNQPSTCCAIETDDWLLVGLDTAYSEHDLANGQAAWAGHLLERAGTRRLILFSHHQPYSLLDKQGPKLAAKLDPLLRAGRIFAWYWGHEHRCVVYAPHPAWGLHGRCIGHAGFPQFRDAVEGYQANEGDPRWRSIPARDLVPSGLLLDMPNPWIEDHGERYGIHGYVTLEFDGPSLTEIFHAADGRELRRMQLA